MHVALQQTDFLGDMIDGDLGWLEHIAANSVDAAADIWSTDAATVPLWLILAARRELVLQAQCLLTDRAEAEADALRDAQDAGDLNDRAEPIPYPRYRGA